MKTQTLHPASNRSVARIRLERRYLSIMKNLKKSGLSKDACALICPIQFVNKNWDEL